MKLNIYFLFFLGLLLAMEILIYHLVDNYDIWFYLLQGVFVVCFFLLGVFYRRVLRPFRVLVGGMDLLKEQDFSTRLIPVGQPEADQLVDLFNRMMNQLKEERLHIQEQNRFLDLLIQVSPMGVILVNLDGEITDMNPVALKLLDLESQCIPVGKRLGELHSPLADELKVLPRQSTVSLRLGDSSIYKCSHLSFLDRGFYHPFYLVESLTKEVIQAEKKAYEKVIRMIAHEVNNTTAGITSTLDSVCESLQDEGIAKDLCEVMQVCVERCYGMSRFITNFADVVKIPIPKLVLCDLNEAVFSCKRFMESVCRDRSIILTMELYDKPLLAWFDASLFEQVLVNIIKNSAESIGYNGKIIIRTVPDLKTSETEVYNERTSSYLEITDNGPGISKDIESKLFSPFFSSKPNGQGLGLIFIREVLLNHHCTFSLRTYEDGLTRFIIRFPRKIK